VKARRQATETAVLIGSDGGRRCDATVRLTGLELATLTTLPQAAGPALLHLACELAAPHDGQHVAFAVAALDGDQWWWLRWAGQAREVVQLDPCDGPAGEPGYDSCLLPHGHPGPHSFEIRP